MKNRSFLGCLWFYFVWTLGQVVYSVGRLSQKCTSDVVAHFSPYLFNTHRAVPLNCCCFLFLNNHIQCSSSSFLPMTQPVHQSSSNTQSLNISVNKWVLTIAPPNSQCYHRLSSLCSVLRPMCHKELDSFIGLKSCGKGSSIFGSDHFFKCIEPLSKRCT